MARICFSGSGQLRGCSAKSLELYALGWLWLLFLPVLAIVYCFPRAVLRSALNPGTKAAVLVGVFGVLAIVGVLVQTHTDAQARADGCINIADAPKYYVDPSGGNNDCPLGYEPGPNWVPPPTTTMPPFDAQNVACAGQQGAVSGPSFPPPVYDATDHVFIVECNDGNEATIQSG